jgi:hypothetical protein
LPTSDAIVDVAMAGASVFWTSSDGSSTTLWQAREGSTGSAASMITVAGKPRGLAVDARAAYAYFTTWVGTTVVLYRCDVAGTAASCGVLTMYASPEPGSVVVGDSAVYWTDPGNGLVSQYSFADRATSTLASGQRSPAAIALGTNDVYWISRIANDTGGDGFAVNALSRESGSSMRVLATGPSPATALATDGVNVYIGSNGAIESVPLAGGAPVNLVTTIADPIDFTCVPGALYWALSAADGVYGLRVP